MNKIFYVRDIVGVVPYWAADYTILDALARFKRLSGKQASKKASIIMFTGENVDNISVNDMGDIEYKKEHTKTIIN